MSFGGEIYGGAPGGQQRGETADMIRVFVRDDDAVVAIERMRQDGKPPQRFALSQPRIHQQARPGSLEQGAIARAARRENAHAKAGGCRGSANALVCDRKASSSCSRSAHGKWTDG